MSRTYNPLTRTVTTNLSLSGILSSIFIFSNIFFFFKNNPSSYSTLLLWKSNCTARKLCFCQWCENEVCFRCKGLWEGATEGSKAQGKVNGRLHLQRIWRSSSSSVRNQALKYKIKSQNFKHKPKYLGLFIRSWIHKFSPGIVETSCLH